MEKRLKNKFMVSFLMLIILMMSILTGKTYAYETVNNGRMINNWYVFNENYQNQLSGSWFNRYSHDWATYCSQKGAPLNDSSILNKTTSEGLNASPDASLILSAIKNWSNTNREYNKLMNSTLYDILTNDEILTDTDGNEVARETILKEDYSKEDRLWLYTKCLVVN